VLALSSRRMGMSDFVRATCLEFRGLCSKYNPTVSLGVMLADAKGKRRIALVVNKDGSPGFSLMDGNEQARLGMSATDKGAGMLFGDAAGKVRASLGIAPTGSASVSLTGSDGDPRAIMIVMPDDTSHFRTYGKDGKIIWKAP
jgi:hypothetical protein